MSKPSQLAKPSYLGLLNAIAVAEGGAARYFDAWAAATTSDEVRAVIGTIGLREAEHSLAFAKRIDELGFAVRRPASDDVQEKVAIAGSDRSDLEKFQRLALGEQMPDGPDVFDGMLADSTIDPQTGGLLGRYICEERDSGRLLRSCRSQLEAASAGAASPDQGDRLAALESKIDSLCSVVEELSARTNGASV